MPAFLAEHLRRRLTRPAITPPAKTKSGTAPLPDQPPPAPPTEQELVDMFVTFLHDGMSMEEVEGQFSASVDPSRWPDIRRRVLERYEAEKGLMGRPEAPPRS